MPPLSLTIPEGEGERGRIASLMGERAPDRDHEHRSVIHLGKVTPIFFAIFDRGLCVFLKKKSETRRSGVTDMKRRFIPGTCKKSTFCFLVIPVFLKTHPVFGLCSYVKRPFFYQPKVPAWFL